MYISIIRHSFILSCTIRYFIGTNNVINLNMIHIVLIQSNKELKVDFSKIKFVPFLTWPAVKCETLTY